jgi:hypothetical protein
LVCTGTSDLEKKAPEEENGCHQFGSTAIQPHLPPRARQGGFRQLFDAPNVSFVTFARRQILWQTRGKAKGVPDIFLPSFLAFGSEQKSSMACANVSGQC